MVETPVFAAQGWLMAKVGPRKMINIALGCMVSGARVCVRVIYV